MLSGPSHAEELARGLPASVVVAGDDNSLNCEIRGYFEPRGFPGFTPTRMRRVWSGRAL